MLRPKLTALIVLVAASLVALFFWYQHQDLIRVQAENRDLKERFAQVESLRQENQRLTEQLRTEAQRPEAENRELLRLRGQVGVLQRAARENSHLEAKVDELAQELKQAEAERNGPEEKNLELRMLASKVHLATVWGHALLKFAKENAGQMPATLAAATPYLKDNDSLPSNWRDTEQIGSIARTNGISIDDFELVYHGSLKGIEDPSRIILLRERQAYQAVDGRWSRIYVYENGFASALWSDDGDFTAVEQGLFR